MGGDESGDSWEWPWDFSKRGTLMLTKKDLVLMGLQIRSRRLFMALEFFKEHQDRSLRARGTMFRWWWLLGNNGGCKDITSSWCHHWEFWLRLSLHLISIPSEIAQEGWLVLRACHLNKVKEKGLERKLAPTTRSHETSTIAPWMWHWVV